MDIDIVCSKCGFKSGITVEESLEDRVIVCPSCCQKNYWHNCPECNTGYIDDKKILNCPDCKPVEIKENKLDQSLSIFEKSCPWCGDAVNILSFLLLKKIIGRCPSCNKYYKDSGSTKALIYYILFSIVAVAVVKPLLLENSSSLFKLITVFSILICGFIVFIKSFSIEKYKD